MVRHRGHTADPLSVAPAQTVINSQMHFVHREDSSITALKTVHFQILYCIYMECHWVLISTGP